MIDRTRFAIFMSYILMDSVQYYAPTLGNCNKKSSGEYRCCFQLPHLDNVFRTRNKVKHTAFNDNLNQYGAKINVSKQDISKTVRNAEIVFRRNV